MDPLDWDKFNGAFLNRFFPLEIGKEKVLDFINPRKRNMSVKEYYLKFTQLAKYASTMVVNSRERMGKLMSGVSKLVFEECRTTMLIK